MYNTWYRCVTRCVIRTRAITRVFWFVTGPLGLGFTRPPSEVDPSDGVRASTAALRGKGSLLRSLCSQPSGWDAVYYVAKTAASSDPDT